MLTATSSMKELKSPFYDIGYLPHEKVLEWVITAETKNVVTLEVGQLMIVINYIPTLNHSLEWRLYCNHFVRLSVYWSVTLSVTDYSASIRRNAKRELT